MREGTLQQCAPPRELYDNPVNMYVAGFIGSPRMNFIPVTISGTKVTASGFTLELPKAPGIEKGMVGFRPEDLTEQVALGEVDARERRERPVLEMDVEVVEVLGSDQFVYGRIGGDEVIARVDPHFTVAAGDKARLGLNMRRIHVFDVETEQAVI
jgi:multiple sugar transport system ATP-binding protein